MAGAFCRGLGRIRCNNILTCRKRVLCRICVYLRNNLVIFILASSKNKNTGKQQTASCNHRCINKLAYLFILLKDKSVFYGSAFLIIFMYFPYSWPSADLVVCVTEQPTLRFDILYSFMVCAQTSAFCVWPLIILSYLIIPRDKERVEARGKQRDRFSHTMIHFLT